MTEYEEKFSKKGNPINKLIAVRKIVRQKVNTRPVIWHIFSNQAYNNL